MQGFFSKIHAKCPWREFLNLIYSRTGGNPFFVEEVLKALIEDGTIFKDSQGRWQRKEISEIQIPQTVATVIRHRLDRLGEDTVGILRFASTFGQSFDLDILKQIVPKAKSEILASHLESALKSGLILQKRRSRLQSESSLLILLLL
jgi:predicted ATPase